MNCQAEGQKVALDGIISLYNGSAQLVHLQLKSAPRLRNTSDIGQKAQGPGWDAPRKSQQYGYLNKTQNMITPNCHANTGAFSWEFTPSRTIVN